MKIYYGVVSIQKNKHFKFNNKPYTLISKPLDPLNKFLRNDANPGSLQICNAFKEDWSNTYINYCPLDITASFLDNGQVEFDRTGLVVERSNPAFKNRISFDLDYGYLIFSEESVILSILPPIFHNEKVKQQAMLTSASYDVGNWFRTIHPSFHLWEGIKNIDIKENDPIMYFQFRTNKKIELVQFEVTNTIMEYSDSCGMHSVLKPFRNLKDRYSDFNQSGFKKRILKEIKNNII